MRVARQLAGAFGSQLLEAPRVELPWFDVQPISGAARLDDVAVPECFSEAGNVTLNDLAPARRRLITPNFIDETIRGDNRVDVG